MSRTTAARTRKGGRTSSSQLGSCAARSGKERFVTGNLRLAAGNHRLTLGVIVSGGLSVKEFVSESVPFEQAKHEFDSVNRGNGDRRGWQVLFKVRFQGENKELLVREDLVHGAAGCAALEEESRSLFGPEHLAGRGGGALLFQRPAAHQPPQETASITGLDVECIVDEPTDIALAYSLDTNAGLDGKTCNVHIFDLKSGTFDVMAI
ncbi:hypothetical protein DVH05_010282 [Phytophthora capsici]|nr:hypothetical protein DVH05_010282 [Phytophthora capsici]